MLCKIQFLVLFKCMRLSDNFNFPLGGTKYYVTDPEEQLFVFCLCHGPWGTIFCSLFLSSTLRKDRLSSVSTMDPKERSSVFRLYHPPWGNIVCLLSLPSTLRKNRLPFVSNRKTVCLLSLSLTPRSSAFCLYHRPWKKIVIQQRRPSFPCRLAMRIYFSSRNSGSTTRCANSIKTLNSHYTFLYRWQ